MSRSRKLALVSRSDKVYLMFVVVIGSKNSSLISFRVYSVKIRKSSIYLENRYILGRGLFMWFHVRVIMKQLAKYTAMETPMLVPRIWWKNFWFLKWMNEFSVTNVSRFLKRVGSGRLVPVLFLKCSVRYSKLSE